MFISLVISSFLICLEISSFGFEVTLLIIVSSL
uniref:Uncharacterized protein n=1 Tax=Siphoviridae sp. ctHip2 TaxID=2827830 RepID=A0A8S5RVZ3_9CAUD|nr:MAG TPA: hypothetical protein [Siphoviridae sp. ctHip2]